MKKIQNLLLCVLLAGAVVGCQEAPSTSEAEPPRAGVADFTVHMKMPDAPETLTPEARAARAQEQTQVLQTFYPVFQQARDWREADKQVRTLLTRSDLPRYALEQAAATLMLRTQLLTDAPGRMTHEKQEAVAYYTTLLVEQQSPEGRIIADALQALEGYWSDAQRAAVASRAATATEDFLNKRLGCVDCTRPLQKVEGTTASTADIFYDQLAGALVDLKALALS